MSLGWHPASRGSGSTSRRIRGRTNANARPIHPRLRTPEFPAGRRKQPARRGCHRSFLESVPEVAAKLKEAHTKERKFEDVVKFVEQATVLVLVY